MTADWTRLPASLLRARREPHRERGARREPRGATTCTSKPPGDDRVGVSRRSDPVTHAPERVREEFDRIADAGYRTGYDASAFFHGEMLAHLPARVERALDLGCGTGEVVGDWRLARIT